MGTTWVNLGLWLLNGRIFAYYAGVSRILRKVATVNTATGIFQLLEEDISISAWLFLVHELAPMGGVREFYV